MEAATSLGLTPGTVRVVEYCDAWPALYDAEEKLLRKAGGDKIGRIAHHGSTAIPGMPAKPILDIVAEVESHEAMMEIIPALEAAGYVFHPEDPVPGRLLLAKLDQAGRVTHHLSLTETNSDFWHKMIIFRDHLLADDAARQAYCELKRDLADKYGDNRESYTSSKTEFVENILAQAEG